jgi:hypothetical protein
MKVIIIQTYVKSYRAPFFEKLYVEGQKRDIDIHVYYSDASGIDAMKGDEAILNSIVGTKVRGWWLGKIMYQNVIFQAFKADVVIIQQEAKHILLYLFILLARLKLIKLAFWGIGYPAYSNQSFIAKFLKKITLNSPSHWFTYTEKSYDYLIENKFSFFSSLTVIDKNSIRQRAY